jgi:hypothetical protein
MPQHHLTAPRGAELAPKSQFREGRFGRLFRNVPSFVPDEAALDALAERMVEPAEAGADSTIPAGYTYLGQFIDHDITFDPASSLQRLNDPDGLHDFRTPRFDLDSLYGDGPNNDPFIYDPAIDDGKTSFLIGRNEAGEEDLPRNVLPASAAGVPQGRALIGDPRNDENVIVGQLHLLFLRFHNKVVQQLSEVPGINGSEQLFAEAQRQVRWHYQWIVVEDFLRRICGDAVVDDILRPDAYVTVAGEATIKRAHLQIYRWQQEPFMPVEFSVAAYRFGHSMIRGVYNLNQKLVEGGVAPIPIFKDGPLAEQHEDLRGFRPLGTQWTIDWEFFFGAGGPLQFARPIDTQLVPPLSTLPDEPEGHLRVLAARNLRRGRAFGLPSGQRVARAMGLDPMSDEALGILDVSAEFTESAPLWFYVLKEAEVSPSEQLGPVGGRIVAEVLLGLLKGDPFSFLSVEPNWKPWLGTTPGEFGMPDLVRFVEGEEPPTPPAPTSGWPPQ